MAAFTTVLKERSDGNNQRVYTYAGHTVQKPMTVTQRRKTPGASQTTVEDTLVVSSGIADSEGSILSNQTTVVITVLRPKGGIQADVLANFDVALDLVASDEFRATLSTQDYIQD